MKFVRVVSVVGFGLFVVAVFAFAEEGSYRIAIRDHRFEPAELRVPANKKMKLFVENQDASAEEFESYDLNREKVVAGNSKVVVYIGPLRPGRYQYFGDFNQKTAQGVIVSAEEGNIS